MSECKISILRTNKDDYGENYTSHLFEQYKLYVETADKISARRMLANSFFLGVHTALITVFAVMLKENIFQSSFTSLIPVLAAMLLCFVWWRIIQSYKQLNSGKFKIIHALEKTMPAALFDEEWIVLGCGVKRNIYIPLTHFEYWVPVCFFVLYLFLAISFYL